MSTFEKEITERFTIIDEGRRAYHKGKTLDDNPYLGRAWTTDKQAEEWKSGYIKEWEADS